MNNIHFVGQSNQQYLSNEFEYLNDKLNNLENKINKLENDNQENQQVICNIINFVLQYNQQSNEINSIPNQQINPFIDIPIPQNETNNTNKIDPFSIPPQN